VRIDGLMFVQGKPSRLKMMDRRRVEENIG
jgi:hypothetical protein